MVGIISLSRLLSRWCARGADSFGASEMPNQLVERAVPALLVAGPRRLGLEARMSEGELRPSINRSQVDLDTRLFARFLGLAAPGPTPAHDQTSGLDDFDILAAALMLGAVEHPEPHPEAAARA